MSAHTPNPIESMEIAIEEAWWRLQRLPACRRVTLYLTRGHAGMRIRPARDRVNAVEIGTYTPAVELADLREDVFWAHAQWRQSMARRAA